MRRRAERLRLYSAGVALPPRGSIFAKERLRFESKNRFPARFPPGKILCFPQKTQDFLGNRGAKRGARLPRASLRAYAAFTRHTQMGCRVLSKYAAAQEERRKPMKTMLGEEITRCSRSGSRRAAPSCQVVSSGIRRPAHGRRQALCPGFRWRTRGKRLVESV